MKKIMLTLFLVAISSSFSVAAKGNIEAGKTKSVVCSACHGVDGNSVVDLYPKVAGQHPTYLQKQLQDFRSAAKTSGEKGRADPVMGGMAVALSDQDIEDLTAYFSSQTLKPSSVADVPVIGEMLYKGGDLSRGIVACSSCHGVDGKGMGLAGFPAVSGQHENYIKSQLIKFKTKSRKNDPNGMMQDISQKLSDEDISALSKYIADLK